MASVDELLLNSLKDLGKEELKTFQWHLKKNHKEISNSELEDADRLKTVDLMVDHFGEEEAVKNTVKILRKMNKNNQAKQLEDNHKQGNRLKLNCSEYRLKKHNNETKDLISF